MIPGFSTDLPELQCDAVFYDAPNERGLVFAGS